MVLVVKTFELAGVAYQYSGEPSRIFFDETIVAHSLEDAKYQLERKYPNSTHFSFSVQREVAVR